MYEQKPSCLKIYSKVTRITLPRGIGYFALEHLATAKLHHLYFTCMSMDAQQPPKGWGADRVSNKFIFTESFSLLCQVHLWFGIISVVPYRLGINGSWPNDLR